MTVKIDMFAAIKKILIEQLGRTLPMETVGYQ